MKSFIRSSDIVIAKVAQRVIKQKVKPTKKTEYYYDGILITKPSNKILASILKSYFKINNDNSILAFVAYLEDLINRDLSWYKENKIMVPKYVKEICPDTFITKRKSQSKVCLYRKEQNKVEKIFSPIQVVEWSKQNKCLINCQCNDCTKQIIAPITVVDKDKKDAIEFLNIINDAINDVSSDEDCPPDCQCYDCVYTSKHFKIEDYPKLTSQQFKSMSDDEIISYGKKRNLAIAQLNKKLKNF